MDFKQGEDLSTVSEHILVGHQGNIPQTKPSQFFSPHKSIQYNPLLNETLSNIDDTSRPDQENFLSISVLQPDYFSLKSNPAHVTSVRANLELENLKEYIYVRYKRKLELVDSYKDSKILLEFRKALLNIGYALSELSFRIVKTSVFETIVILVVLMNTVVLIFEDPSSPDVENFSGIENFFIYFYTAECLIKINAYGFVISKGSYLRDRWNLMDFVIIISAWISTYGGSNVKLSALRMLRILRPLRSISSIKGIRALFLALFKSIKHLMSSLVILLFFIFIFAIAALQLWSGTLRKKCILIDEGSYLNTVPCGVSICPEFFECGDTLNNPNNGTSDFDNIFISMIMIFQILTLEGWTQLLEWNQRAFSYYSVLFYIPLIFLGSYLIMNLSLAIITSSFTDAMQSGNKVEEENVSLDYLDDDYPIVEPLIRPKKRNHSDEFLLENSQKKASIVVVNPEVKMRFQKLRIKGIKSIKQHRIQQTGELDLESLDSIDFHNGSSRYLQKSSRDNEEISPISSVSSLEVSPKNIKTGAFRSVQNEAALIKTYTSAIEFMGSSEYETPISRSTLKRIKSVLSIKADSFASNTKKLDKNFTLGINDAYNLSSTSKKDVIPYNGIIKYNHFYTFKYIQENCVLVNERLIEKYFDMNESEIFAFLRGKYGGKRAFEVFHLSVRQYIKDKQTEDTFNMAINGQWSGKDVNPMYVYEDFERLQGMPYTLWTNKLIQQPMFIISKLVQHKITQNLVTLAVMTNTIVLAIDHYGISNELSAILTKLNTFFTYFFAIELFLRFCGLGISEFIRDKMNHFDTVVVILSIIELSILSGSTSAFSAFRAIRVFRIFRVLRVVRLLRYFNSISKIIKAVGKSISNFIYLFMLLILFLVIFTLLGMKIFGGQFNFNEGLPRGNFDTFHWAFVTMFQVLSTENWNDILTSALRSSAGIGGSLFLVTWVILGNFIFLNLFLAILIESFSEEKDEGFFDSFEKAIVIAKRRFSKDMRRLDEFESINFTFADNFETQKTEKDDFNVLRYDDIKCEKSYYMFSKNNAFRKLCFKIVSNPKFDSFSLFLIVSNSIKLVWDTYLLELNAEDTQRKISDYFDYVFTIIFSFEFMLKSISQGFALAQNSYLKDNWNRVDFIIIILSIIDSAISSVNIPIIKVFRILRCIRPLKLISHNISMKIVVIALVESITAILNVLIVILIIWLVFAILGVSVLSGKMHYCSNNQIESQTQCESSGYSWENTNSNFDNVIEAMATLFIVMSQESWPNRMFEGVDARDVGISPKKNANPPMAYFYIVYYVIGNFFLVNLFTAVVFDKFSDAKRNQSTMSALLLNKDQMNWSEIQKMLLGSKVIVEPSVVPKDYFRALLFKTVKSRVFEIGMMVIILINMILMALPYEQASKEYLNALENINLALTFVFFLEAIIKNIALGPKLYFKNNWNKFDFFVVITSAADFMLQIFIGSNVKYLRSFPQLIRVLRVLRIGRVLRIVKSLQSLQNLIMTITYALPALLNILSLMVLIMFIFAVLGSFLFHSVHQGEYIIGEYFNFTNFGYSMMILWRISTGEDYPSIMYDISNSLGSKLCYIYFIVFLTVMDFIILELFVSVIIQNYEEQAENQETPLQIFTTEQKKFRRYWNYYSFQHSNYRLDKENLIDFLCEYGPKAEILKENASRIEIILLINGMDIKHANEYFYYHDVLFAILKRKYGKLKKSKTPNIYSLKLTRIEELQTSKKLSKLREKSMQEFNDRVGRLKNTENVFFKIMMTRSVFRSWKNYIKAKKNRRGSEISITPRFSECDYPGETSFVSEYK